MSIGKRPCPGCGGPLYRGSPQCLECYRKARLCPQEPPTTPVQQIAEDRERNRTTAQLTALRARYNEALRTIERQEHELGVTGQLHQNLDTFTILPKHSSRTSEATAVVVASDWHVEENVGPEMGGLNTYSLAIAKTRSERFFQSTLRLVKLLQQDVAIDTIVLALLGDFISNDIHDELADVNEALPIHALATAQSYLVSGITFLLQHFEGKLVVPCHSGNHARTTQKTRFSVENGHSLEYLMYLHLAAYFRDESRIEFIIPPGMHSYLKVYDQTIRFQHGHAIKYGGGVGGIYIPVNKAIAQWNKGRHADLDVFGHFHQMRDGGNFICNGSLVGYNAFALSIKADYEKPKQALFLIDKRRAKTCVWPILVE